MNTLLQRRLHRKILRHIHSLPVATMVKGKATATVSGRVIAETDEYEFVEGNVYVSL